jgi:hypothetical protein
VEFSVNTYSARCVSSCEAGLQDSNIGSRVIALGVLEALRVHPFLKVTVRRRAVHVLHLGGFACHGAGCAIYVVVSVEMGTGKLRIPGVSCVRDFKGGVVSRITKNGAQEFRGESLLMRYAVSRRVFSGYQKKLVRPGLSIKN